jgi:predicted nucleic acid-binding protein
MNFYSTDQLEMEIARHWQKLRKMAGYNEAELYKATALITHRIKFISVELIPIKILLKSAALLADIDEDDTEFVALAEHIRGQLWTGDKQLAKGLQAKEWKKVITTEQLYRTVYKSG